jgi:hypothetical protein
MPAGRPPGILNGGGGRPPGRSPVRITAQGNCDARACLPAGKPNGGGGKGCTPGFCPSIGFEEDCPSAAYDDVMESITDCAFSWPISKGWSIWEVEC